MMYLQPIARGHAGELPLTRGAGLGEIIDWGVRSNDHPDCSTIHAIEREMNLTDFLAAQHERFDQIAIVWLKNPALSLLEVWIEPWGSALFLLPEHRYAVVAEAANGDVVETATIEFAECAAVWPQGRKSNRTFRDDGGLVWDDADASAVASCLESLGVLEVLRWLDERSQRGQKAVPRDELAELIRARLGIPSERRDQDALLIEHGIVGLDNHGAVFLTSWGGTLLERYKNSNGLSQSVD